MYIHREREREREIERLYIYIYICIKRVRTCWLRTHGVNTHGVAAKVINFDVLGKKVRPGTFGKIKVG